MYAELSHLLSVDTPVVRLQHNEALSRDVDSGALNLLDVGLVLVGGDNLLHLLRGDGEAGRRCPDARAVGGEDGGFVDVACADQANEESVSRSESRMVICVSWEDGVSAMRTSG